MKFFDLHVQTENIEEIAKFAKDLGYSGIALCNEWESTEKLDKLKEKIAKVKDVEIYLGVTITTKNPDELRKIIDKVREKVMILIVRGGDFAINRVACENPKVDMLAHPELGRIDIGLDETCLKKAAENNVAIQVSFREIINSYRKPRSYIFNHIATNLRLADKFNTPIIICSGAQDKWEMRGPRELVSVLNVLGLDLGKAFASVTSTPQNIVEKNRDTLEGKRVTKGVKIE
jgi:ribonuclease P/MRP protein subunit RPP1